MPLETATFIPDLDAANPAHTDPLSQADSHMRLLKSTIQATFPNFTDVALQSTQAQIDLATSQSRGAAPAVIPMGTAALPGIAFLADLGTGMWQPATGQMGWSISGAQVMLMGSSALVTSLAFAAPAIAAGGAFSGGTGQLVPIGSTLIWWDYTLPVEGGYVWANGTPISRTAYPILFARWGTKFGIGDGSTTFGIPDLRDSVPVGSSTMGVSPRGLITAWANTVLGSLIGVANNVLVAANLPPITSINSIQPISVYPQGNGAWTVPVNTAGSNWGDTGLVPGNGSAGYTTENASSQNGSVSSFSANNSISVVSTGTTSTPVNNVQSSVTCTYIIRAA